MTSSLVPLPYGGRGHSEAVDATHNNNPPPRPRDEVTNALANTMQPATLVRALDHADCPYCATWPDLPCAIHATRLAGAR